MEENTSDEEFRSRMLRFAEIADQKFDGVNSDIITNSYRLDKYESTRGALVFEIQHFRYAVRNLAASR